MTYESQLTELYRTPEYKSKENKPELIGLAIIATNTNAMKENLDARSCHEAAIAIQMIPAIIGISKKRVEYQNNAVPNKIRCTFRHLLKRLNHCIAVCHDRLRDSKI
jgi:hypothetical protein